ncbi:MAG: phosphonopyruvate decarboxylase [Rhodospirillales bacterium]|nr:phosphonopyruvate decarboxylase [Rhodospirillales bacterium]
MARPRQTRKDGGVDWPKAVHRVLRVADIRHIAFVPDAGLSRLIDLCGADPAMRLIPLTTEEEGIGVLAGAWLGGERGVLLMQSSGVGNCINAFSLIATCRFPFLAIVTMRGEWGEFNPWQVPMGQKAEAALKLAGVVPYRPEDEASIAPTVDAAQKFARDSDVATAVLVSQALIGMKRW